jgi:lysophospholipase L1-like esterase
MMKTSVLPKIGLAVCAALLTLGLCELAARALLPAPPNPTREPQIVYLSDPEIRYVNLPNQKGWIDDGFVTINSRGFRGPEVVSPKPAGRFRLVIIGDSLTFGWGVGDAETFGARLEQLLHKNLPDRNIEVINLGVGGYNTRQEVALLKRNVARLEPDMVLVGFYSNDVPEAVENQALSAPGGTAAGRPEKGRVLHINPTPTDWWNRLLRRSRVLYTTGRALRRLTGSGEWGMSGFSMELDLLQGKQSTSLDRAWETVEHQLGELRSIADAYRFSAGIVVLPCREQVMGQYATAQYQSRVRAIADRLGFFVIDPLPRLAGSETKKEELFIPYDRNHPSAAGHVVIAQAIFEYLNGNENLTALSKHARAGELVTR